MTKQEEALQLLGEALRELESPKGSILSSVQKLSRASELVGDESVHKWCAVQLGDRRLGCLMERLLEALSDPELKSESIEAQEVLAKAWAEVEAAGLKHCLSDEEANVKRAESGGGYHSIGFVEERYTDLVRTKRGNDGTYYKHNLSSNLNYVRRKAHELASGLYNQLKFAGTTASCFDLLRDAVDNRMLDLDPSLAEQLMLAFKGVSSSDEEEWSQALTTCRRLIEHLADALFPATDRLVNDRPLDQAHYINRLWAFMDSAISSSANKELAKTHLDYLGTWLEKITKLSHKGVHAKVTQLEGVKAVFHAYLMLADVLEYLGAGFVREGKPNINTATIDELEALLEIRRAVARDVVKARVKLGSLDRTTLAKVPGVGTKTVGRAIERFII